MGRAGFGPNTMHGPVGNAYWGTLGRFMDQQLMQLQIALRARFPDDAAALGMEDALALLGNERKLPRGGSAPTVQDESLADWATRLKDAWDIWALAGHALGILRELKTAGFPSGADNLLLINHIGRAHTLDENDDLVVTNPCMECANRRTKAGTLPASPLQGFTLDLRDQFFAGFTLLFLVDVPSLTNDVGNTAKARLNEIVRNWRQGGAIYKGATVFPVAADKWILGWPPDVTLGQAGLVIGDNGARVIDPE